MKCLQHKGSKVIQTKKDADIQISNAPLILSLFKSITPIGEAIPRLDLLLYHVLLTNCTYFISIGARRSQMSIISRNLENQRILTYCFSMSTKCDITYIVLLIGKKMWFKRIVKKEKGTKDWWIQIAED